MYLSVARTMLEALMFIVLSIGVFLSWLSLQNKTGWSAFNPLLLSLATIVTVLSILGYSYEEYMHGGRFISALIEPSVVALGYPLYKQLPILRKAWLSLLSIGLFTSLCALTVSVLFAQAIGLEEWVVRSLALLCITTAIAMETSAQIGGVPALSAVMVMIAGFTGSAFGLTWLALFGLRHPKVVGMAIGSTSHALGAATLVRYSQQSVAFASTALIICALITAIVAPLYVPWLISL